jgi:hypothetical protein|tara:strand:- start:7 stop:1416 length:1410 start_codon:yes stop_codon:yes gene_type:complete
MAAIITEHFRQHNAEQFHESFSEAAATTYYLFIGKSSPFTTTTSGGDDSSPPVPVDDVTTEHYKWDSMLAAKLISSSDVSFALPRRNWANSTTYDMYEHDISSSNTTTSSATNLYASTFYFMTSAYRVYKVLDNNGGVAYSGSEPTSETSTPFELGGYRLQYMYKITTSEVTKFLTSDFMPVSTDTSVSGDAVDGALDVVRTVAGSGYTNGTYYSPVDGDGANGIVKIIVSGGAIVKQGSAGTNMYTVGTGYRFANVDLTNVYSNTALSTAANIGSGTGGSVQPIISPKGGHGKDAVHELGGHFVITNVKLEQNEGADFTVSNDFREVGLVKNPFNFGTTTVATASTARQTSKITLSGAPSTAYQIDEKITQSVTGAVGKVVEFDSTNNIIYYQQEKYANYGLHANGNLVAFSGTNVITGATSTGVATAATYATPELQPDSGKVIYVENRRPISRASDQTEDIKIVVEF